MKILLIEDSKVVQSQIIGLLQDETVECVPALKDGLQIILEQPVDIVLLDLNLEDSEGADTVRTLRKVWSGPMVVVSGCATQWDIKSERVLNKDVLRTSSSRLLLQKTIQASISESKTQMLTRQRIPVAPNTLTKCVAGLCGVGAGQKLFSLGAEV